MSLADPVVKKTGTNSYNVSYGDDSQTHAEFIDDVILNSRKSEEAGHPVYDSKVFVSIRYPGDKTKATYKPATDEHKQRYPHQWAAYQEGRKQVPDGFALEQWPILTKAEALNLKSMGIHTVEQLAALPDTALSFFGARSYRDKAQVTLAKATDGSAVLALKAENEVLKADLEAMKEQIKELANLNKKEKDKDNGSKR